jgi:hypothetical protein
MNRFSWLSVSLFTAAVTAWWDAWDWLWERISDLFDPDCQRDQKSLDRNDSIHDVAERGTFYAAGVGSDGD